MSTPRTTDQGPVTRGLVGSGAFAGHPFVLVDVGVSGGIGHHWRQFEPTLTAFGFDPLVRECERLSADEKNRNVTYHDYFVGFESYSSLFPARHATGSPALWSNQPFQRTSAYRAQRQQSMSISQWFNNQNPDVVYTERRTSLDEFFRGFPEVKVDFIKVDTDGHDYEVLCGAERVLDEHGVLGLLVETQFHGVSHPHSNLFANIDRLLREHGFSLFDLEIYRYTRAVLPGHFVYSLPAQTREGQVLAGDALYLRDLSAPGYAERWGSVMDPAKVLKLVCLFEIFGMPDCSVEILLDKKNNLGSRVNTEKLVNILAQELHPWAGTLDEVNRRFQASAEAFYPRTLTERLRRSLPRPVSRGLSNFKRKLLG